MTITPEKLAAWEQDIDALGAVVNGEEDDPDVVTRLGRTIPVLARLLAGISSDVVLAQEARQLAADWAEKPTAPAGVGTKSAKTHAQDAANSAQSASNALATMQDLEDDAAAHAAAAAASAALAVGQLPAVALFNGLGSANIPAGFNMIMTTGFATLGRGAAIYVRWAAPLAALPAWGENVWWKQAADTSRWYLYNGQTITSDMFGTPGDGAMAYLSEVASGTDVSPHLNNMRRWGLSSWGVPRGVLSAGMHRVEDTVHLALGETYSLGYSLFGATGSAWGLWDTAFRCARIVTSKNDRPIMSVQGARGGVLAHVAFYGPLANRIISNNLGRCVAPLPTIDDRPRSAWLPGSGPHSNGRYNPGCAVAIDPYAGTRPGSSYPDAPYNAAAGESTTQYGRLPTSQFTVTGCVIGGFSVGIVVQPSDFDGNGDYIATPNNEINYCIVCLAAGNSQSRNLDTTNLKYAMVHTVLDGNAYGKQRGAIGGLHANWSGGHQIALVDYNVGFTGPLTIDKPYAEGCHRIGNIVGSGTGKFRLRDVKLSYFSGPDVAGMSPIRGAPFNHLGLSPTSHAAVACPVEITGEITKSVAFVINANDCRIDVSMVDHAWPAGQPCPQYRAIERNGTMNGILVGRKNSTFTGEILVKGSYLLYNAASTPNAATNGTRLFDGVIAETPTRAYPAPMYASRFRGQSMLNSVPMPYHTAISGGAAGTLTGRVFKWIRAGWANAGHGQRWALLPGDVVQHSSGYWAVVTSFDTATDEFTFLIENGWANNGGTITWETGDAASVQASLSGGTWYSYGCRRYGPSNHLSGDFTSGSDDITNVGIELGTGAATNITDIGVGDFIFYMAGVDGPISHPRNVVTAVDAPTKTINGTNGWGGSLTQTRKTLLFCTSIAPNVPNP